MTLMQSLFVLTQLAKQQKLLKQRGDSLSNKSNGQGSYQDYSDDESFVSYESDKPVVPTKLEKALKRGNYLKMLEQQE